MSMESDLKRAHSGDENDAVISDGVFSALPPTFILPTHMNLDQLHDVELLLIKNGGTLTYDVVEAGLILGSITQKKRLILELRARGIWMEQIENSHHLPGDLDHREIHREPVSKRQKLDNERKSPERQEEMTPQSKSAKFDITDPSSNDETKTLEEAQTVTVVKLEWLTQSIGKGHALPLDPFVVFRGRKTLPGPATLPNCPGSITASQIKKRAQEDVSFRPMPKQNPTGANFKMSEKSIEQSSSRNPPILHRESTSEHEELAELPIQPNWVRDQVVYSCMRSAPLCPPNDKFITQLDKIRKTRELTLDDIGVRAYSTSIAAVAAYPYVINRPSEILALPGCDVKTANLFAEFQQKNELDDSSTEINGTIAAADALEKDSALRVLKTFTGIWGVGAKTARDFYFSRGWRDLDDIVEFGWDSLSRVQQIGVKFYDEFQLGVPRAQSEHIAGVIKSHANSTRPDGNDGIEAILVGGYRRGKEVCGDVDIILTHRNDAITKTLIVDLVASLEKEQYITHTLSLHVTSTFREQQPRSFSENNEKDHFDVLDKALVVWQEPSRHASDQSNSPHAATRIRNPNLHHRVDIIISPWRTIGCAVLGWTGDTTFQRDLRRYAKKAHDWRFDSSGIRARTSSGQVVDLEYDGTTWEERERLVMEGLGIGWRPPEERCSR